MFNGAHLHLILNHLPITGFCIASVFALVAFFKTDFRRLALKGIVLSALLTLPAYITGDAAEDVVKSHAGLVISNDMLLAHEQAAQWAMIAAIISGLLAALALWSRLTETNFRRLYPLVLIVCIWATSVILTTSFHGGKIHHPEIISP